jgi:anti-sigma-K factor RskA
MDAYVQARSAAVVALAGMALRQLLDDARAEAPEVVAVRVAASHSAAGVAIDFELTDRAGHAVGGGSL